MDKKIILLLTKCWKGSILLEVIDQPKTVGVLQHKT